jgi:hypothetical protein
MRASPESIELRFFALDPFRQTVFLSNETPPFLD